MSIQDFNGDFNYKSNFIIYKGPVYVYAEMTDVNGRLIDLYYNLNIQAFSEIECEESNKQIGWDYKRDTPTYSQKRYAVALPTKIESVEFTHDIFIVDGEEMSLNSAMQHLGPTIIKKILDPSLYIKDFDRMFADKIEEWEED